MAEKAEKMRKWFEDNPDEYEKHKARLRLRYAENPNKFKKRTKNYRETHKKWKQDYDKKYRETHEKEVKRSIKNWREKNPDYIKEHKRLSFQQIMKDPIKKKKRYKKQKANRDDIKYEVLLHYSPKGSKVPTCCCCKITGLHFLTIDHIHGRGSEHRRKWGREIYRWLKVRNFPKGHQTYCWNCNISKSLGGRKSKTCPHKIKQQQTYQQ